MMLMKKKRTIKLKDPRLRKARTELRTLLRLVWEKKTLELHDQIDAIYDDKSLDYEARKPKIRQIKEKIKALDFAYKRAPHGCCVCGRREPDLTYNPCDSTWYCEDCYEFNQSYYKRNPHPYEPDWRRLYP